MSHSTFQDLQPKTVRDLCELFGKTKIDIWKLINNKFLPYPLLIQHDVWAWPPQCFRFVVEQCESIYGPLPGKWGE